MTNIAFPSLSTSLYIYGIRIAKHLVATLITWFTLFFQSTFQHIYLFRSLYAINTMYVQILMLRRERAKMSLMIGKYSQTEHGIMLTNCSMNALNYLKLHELWNKMNPPFIAFKFKIQCKMWIVLFFAVFVVRYVELSVIWCEIAKEICFICQLYSFVDNSLFIDGLYLFIALW